MGGGNIVEGKVATELSDVDNLGVPKFVGYPHLSSEVNGTDKAS